MSQDELAHFGVKGMRWGIRKASPSPVTSSGKKPANSKLTHAQKKEIRAKAKEKAKRIKATKLKDLTRRQNQAAMKAAERARKSALGVGIAKVPGRLEAYHTSQISMGSLATNLAFVAALGYYATRRGI